VSQNERLGRIHFLGVPCGRLLGRDRFRPAGDNENDLAAPPSTHGRRIKTASRHYRPMGLRRSGWFDDETFYCGPPPNRPKARMTLRDELEIMTRSRDAWRKIACEAQKRLTEKLEESRAAA